jgi:hypothetical protein
MKTKLALALCLSLAALSLAANANDESVDWQMMSRIRDEGFANSKVMQTLSQLTDVVGPRLTGSPGMKAANEWTRKQLEEWGLVNAHLESWGEFGRGWSYSRAVVHMLQPAATTLIAYPKAWTPGTDGPVKAKVVKAKLETDADLEQWRGKLQGAIVMLGEPRELLPPDKVAFTRHGEKELEDLSLFQIPGARPQGRQAQQGPGQPANRQEAQRRQRFQRTQREFLAAEKALATIEGSRGDAGDAVRAGRRLARERRADRAARAGDGGRALQPHRAPARAEEGRRARGRRARAVPRRRQPGLQHDRRDPRHRQEG